MKLYGMKGEIYEVICEEKPLIEEAHGWLFPVEGHPELTAKLFHPDGLMNGQDKAKEKNFRKLMELWIPGDALEHVIWPADGLWDKKGFFLGFMRPAVSGYLTLETVVNQQRTMDVEDKLRIARQLIAAVNSVHRMDVLCGNLHRQNILVSQDYDKVLLAGADYFLFRKEEGGCFALNESVYRNPDTGLRIPRVSDDLAVANHLKKLFESQLLEMKLPHWERAFFRAFLGGMGNPMRRPRLEEYEELLDELEEMLKKEK